MKGIAPGLPAQAAVLSRSGAPGFRADIQGLRALAIISVVACHAGLPGFAGGFVGVDMFFVISGYLITGLLLAEIHTSGEVRLLRFYSRRCKRLLPALLVVTCISLLLARVILAPLEQLTQIEAAGYVPLWLSNVYFALSDVDYFAPEAATNLFLHTWSLGVEEQFYLVWPLLIAGLIGARTAADSGFQAGLTNLRNGLALVLGASFLLCVFWSWRAPQLAFYMMPARAWQFALGGLVCLLCTRSADFTSPASRLGLPGGVPVWCEYAGILLIVLAVVMLDVTQTYPGYLALLPAAGTALLLAGGASDSRSSISRLLTLRGMQWAGNVSYSWYLWHWPILILGNMVFGGLWGGSGLQLALILVSLLLAALTYASVEAPFRHSQLLTRKPGLTIGLTLTTMLCMTVGAQWMGTRADRDASSPGQLQYLQVRSDMPRLYANGCDEWYSNARVVGCSYGNPEAEQTAVLIGDSIGAQWFSAFASPLIGAGWRFIVYTKSSCPIVDEPIFYARIGMLYEVCAAWRETMLAGVAELAPDLIFVGSAATYAYTAEQWRIGTRSVLARLAPVTSDLYLIRGTPMLPFNGPACLARSSWQPALLRQLNVCSAVVESPQHDSVHAALQAAASEYPNAHLLDLNPLVCENRQCAAQRDGMLVFRDEQHLSDVFVASLAPRVMELLAPLPLPHAVSGKAPAVE